MKHANSQALHDHWNRLRGRRKAAARADIRPREFGPLLPDLFLMETDVTSGATLRFCGAAIARRYGRDLEGESFLGLWTGEDRQTIRRNLAMLRMAGSGFVMGVTVETAGGGHTAFEMLLLPLLGQNTPDGAIGSMGRIGGHNDTNRIRARIVSQEIRSIRFLDEGGPAIQLPLREPRLLDEAFAGPAPVSRERSHLTLVIGGKS